MLGPDVSDSGVMHARLVCELLDRCLDLPALLLEENKLDRDADVPKELQSVVNARAFPLTAPLDLKGLSEPESRAAGAGLARLLLLVPCDNSLQRPERDRDGFRYFVLPPMVRRDDRHRLKRRQRVGAVCREHLLRACEEDGPLSCSAVKGQLASVHGDTSS